MTKSLQLVMLVVIMFFSNSSKAFWFDIPNDIETITTLGKIEHMKPSLNPKHINVLVWNIYKGGLLSWRIDLQRFTQNRDLVILQEGILNNDMRAELDASHRHEFIFATSFTYKSSGHATGVVTGSTAAPIDTHYMRSIGREIIGFSPKMVLITKYALTGMTKELMVINIHALNTVSWKKLATQVIDALRVAKGHEGPVLFAGDFNSWSKKKEAFVLRAMKRAGFKNVELKLQDQRLHVFGRPVDYIFTKGLKTHWAEVVVDAMGSDHKPLAGIFEVIE
ncbi:MAG: hypothetical protein COW01_14145 [Bdellovibrionales bacterium CG12_big_fil_rev_8_21_14_0_65_38_15]|nr:MAG: hypothetical protein COW79_16965 [Bdellovibrionales bacterium CG22_combo_CG10-13_8_21_14_all_38_13]PIQ53414.1 MAG: hypothetical protein COW01_14145 [Bdellovibrionales bacterium CG12_big_fil_rev_8_21_14_0_65_38_15]PIR30223.1 MAG: hypothetical protein COV38_05610 [Bdellovibrionales bacterium CG11_big_fil_rev_8_21_14_0_20_38_13]